LHTFIHVEYTDNGVDYEDYLYMGFFASSSTNLTNLKNATFLIENASYYSGNKLLYMYIGSAVRDHGGTLHLTVEYTKEEI
jgi:hypothetical protein